MRLLLDTHIWLWWLEDSKALKPLPRQLIESNESEVYVSVISLWEAVVKAGTGKLTLTADLESASTDSDIRLLPMMPRDALAVGKLPLHHRDPFDRALVAQAHVGGLRLITADIHLMSYQNFADIQLV